MSLEQKDGLWSHQAASASIPAARVKPESRCGLNLLCSFFYLTGGKQTEEDQSALWLRWLTSGFSSKKRTPPLPELLMLNKQNPGDFSGFWLLGDLQAALPVDSRLVLPSGPRGSSPPCLAGEGANPDTMPWDWAWVPAPTRMPTQGGRGRPGCSIFEFQCSIFACVT